jgi:hypothetical protein
MRFADFTDLELEALRGAMYAAEQESKWNEPPTSGWVAPASAVVEGPLERELDAEIARRA